MNPVAHYYCLFIEPSDNRPDLDWIRLRGKDIHEKECLTVEDACLVGVDLSNALSFLWSCVDLLNYIYAHICARWHTRALVELPTSVCAQRALQKNWREWTGQWPADEEAHDEGDLMKG